MSAPAPIFLVVRIVTGGNEGLDDGLSVLYRCSKRGEARAKAESYATSARSDRYTFLVFQCVDSVSAVAHYDIKHTEVKL